MSQRPALSLLLSTPIGKIGRAALTNSLERKLGQTEEGIIYEMSSEINSPNPNLTVLKIADFPNVLKLIYFSGLSVQIE